MIYYLEHEKLLPEQVIKEFLKELKIYRKY